MNRTVQPSSGIAGLESVAFEVIAEKGGRQYAEYPYLVTRLASNFHHVIALPDDLGEAGLRRLARWQMEANRLPTALVIAGDHTIFLAPDGRTADVEGRPGHAAQCADWLLPAAPPWVMQRAGRAAMSLSLFAPASVPPDGWEPDRDPTCGGRPATEDERRGLAGLLFERFPGGLLPCPRCGEWWGECLDPNPRRAGLVQQVHCSCENHNRCAICWEPLGPRRLDANYFDEDEGRIVHVAAWEGIRHLCRRLVLEDGTEREIAR